MVGFTESRTATRSTSCRVVDLALSRAQIRAATIERIEANVVPEAAQTVTQTPGALADVITDPLPKCWPRRGLARSLSGVVKSSTAMNADHSEPYTLKNFGGKNRIPAQSERSSQK
jgi:hypothetical protein